MPARKKFNESSGFTLIELLVTVALVGILLSMAAPDFRSFSQDAKQVTTYNRIASVLRHARSEAIKRSSSITICPNDLNSGCGNDWSKGMLIFHDALSNGEPLVLDGTDTIIRSISLSPSNITVSATAVVTPLTTLTSQSSIRFDGRGQTNWTTGTWVLCDSRDEEYARALIINGAGLGRRAYSTAASGDVVVDARGAAVEC